MKIDYYSNKEYVSNSEIGWLEKSPKYYKEKMRGHNEYSPAFELGSMVHMSILEPDKFIVAKQDKPTGLMGVLVDKFLSIDINESTSEEEAFKAAYNSSGFKQNSDTVYKKFLEKNIQEYITERRENNNRLFLDVKTKSIVNNCLNSVLNLKGISELIETGKDRFEEIEIYWTDDLNIKRKSKIDKLIVNVDKKIATNIDIKTTSDNVYLRPIEKEIKSDNILENYFFRGFMRSYIKYSYYRQQAFYEDAIKAFCKSEYNIDNIKVNQLIIAVETKSPYNSAVYRFADKWIELGRNKVKELLNDLIWHRETNSWTYPRDMNDNFIIDI